MRLSGLYRVGSLFILWGFPVSPGDKTVDSHFRFWPAEGTVVCDPVSSFAETDDHLTRKIEPGMAGGWSPANLRAGPVPIRAPLPHTSIPSA